MKVRIDEEYVESRHEDIEPGRYVMLAISDTGEGIPPQNIHSVFEPFFSTKGPGKGSGLGLSMVQGFMKQSGGSIRVYSEVGKGTTFKLYFPAVFDTIEDKSDAAAAALPKVTSGTRILVVEDEPVLMTIIVTILERNGYQVISANSGDAALELFERSGPIDLLLTDLVMPGRLQGPNLAKELRLIQPSLPAIFMSGFANEATVHGNGLRPEDIRVMKPISRATLIKSIEKALIASPTKPPPPT